MFRITTEEYRSKGQVIGPVMRDFERQILLQIIDNSWKEHLGSVEALRQGIGLRSYASKNPKLEFRRESFGLFESLLNNIRVEGIKFLSRVQLEVDSANNLKMEQRDRESEVYQHQDAQSAFSNPEVPASPQHNKQDNNSVSGNRRLRRAEAKIAREKDKKN